MKLINILKISSALYSIVTSSFTTDWESAGNYKILIFIHKKENTMQILNSKVKLLLVIFY